jgi:hypothetical protein
MKFLVGIFVALQLVLTGWLVFENRKLASKVADTDRRLVDFSRRELLAKLDPKKAEAEIARSQMVLDSFHKLRDLEEKVDNGQKLFMGFLTWVMPKLPEGDARNSASEAKDRFRAFMEKGEAEATESAMRVRVNELERKSEATERKLR